MNEQNMHETMDDTPITTYIYDSQKSASTIQSSYEKELGNRERMDIPKGGDSRSGRKGGHSMKILLASFLAGALVIGGLSYMADKENLFSGGEQTVMSKGSTSSVQNSGVTTAALSSSNDIASVYKAASPAVVKIENYMTQTNSTMFDSNLLFGGRQGGRQQQQSSELELMGSGSGFFFEKNGYILTNEHVVANATELKVTVQGYDEPLIAKVVGANNELDLAVLKVESPDGQAFPSLTLGDSNKTNIGDWVIAIGNPYGFDHSLTMGVLSAKERPITITDDQGDHEYKHLLQTDASINPGNSGGPLLNDQGEVIGINTAVNAEAQGIGFAIPTSTIAGVLNKLMTHST